MKKTILISFILVLLFIISGCFHKPPVPTAPTVNDTPGVKTSPLPAPTGQPKPVSPKTEAPAESSLTPAEKEKLQKELEAIEALSNDLSGMDNSVSDLDQDEDL